MPTVELTNQGGAGEVCSFLQDGPLIDLVRGASALLAEKKKKKAEQVVRHDGQYVINQETLTR